MYDDLQGKGRKENKTRGALMNLYVGFPGTSIFHSRLSGAVISGFIETK